MNKIDKLMNRVKPKPTINERLAQDNPYLSKTSEELLNYMCRDNYQAPEKGTPMWGKFIYALCHARNIGGLTEND